MDVMQEYADKKKTPEQIAACVESGWSCCADISGAIPPVLAEALGKRAASGEIQDVTCHTLLDVTEI